VATVLEGYVVSVVEPWHYSLYAFMDGVESFYGSAMKDKIDGDTLVLTQYVRMKEFHLYGSSRLGILNQNDTLKRADLHYKLSISDPGQEPELFMATVNLNQYAPDSIYTLKQGNRLYEGTNHLGNVLVTFSDKRIGYCTNDTIYYYRADVRTANDYAAFGAPLDDRQWYSTADSGVYRFGFNGMEKDNEAKGQGNSYDFGARIYDSRLGRWLSLDPMAREYPEYSDYSFAGNSPILFLDKDGRVIGNPNDPDAQKLKAALTKTDAGKVLWQQMEASEKTIFIYIGAPEGGGEVRSNINKHLSSINAGGEVVSGLMFEKISSGESPSDEDMEGSYKFNSETGEYDKTSAFDNTYILINGTTLELDAAVLGIILEDEQKGADVSMIRIGGEEAAHSVQEYADFAEKQVDPKTGKYVEPSEANKPYLERRNELEAKDRAKIIETEYLEKP